MTPGRDVRAPALPLDVVDQLPTPCLVVDVAACQRNIGRARDLIAGSALKLRPHFKAHKCVELMRRQLADGAGAGVTCATAAEAEALAREGFIDILIANQVVHQAGLRALGRAARRSRLTVAIDHIRQVELLAEEAERSRVRIEVLIEINVGMARCGIEPGSDTLYVLAEAVANSKGLELRGLQGYEGHVVLSSDRQERLTGVRRAGEILSQERDRLVRRGHPCPLLSGGGTGTMELAAEVGVLAEVQAGSYALMDATYGDLQLPFESALFVASTVISHPQQDRLTLNAGLKSVSAEYGMPTSLTDGLRVLELSDEHASVAVMDGVSANVGDTVFMVPGHIDPTVNLHDVLFCWDSTGGRLELWPVDGRRAEGLEALLS